MPHKKIITSSVDCDSDRKDCIYEEITICPTCHHALVPQPLNGYFVEHTKNIMGYDDPTYTVYISFFCTRCRQIFLIKYHAFINSYSNLKTSQVLGVYPFFNKEVQFSVAVASLSPMFVTTYSQSETAESDQLNEVAGCGYRKSVEYLVKDYLCHRFPQLADEIKSEFLGTSIKRINDERIKTLAERAVWIGNDETHYVRKHEDLEIKDMKQFITAMLHYVEAELTFEEALAVQKK